MSSVTLRVGGTQHTDPTFSWWELYGSQTNHALADVIANAEFDTFFFGRHAHHVNLTIGETWHYWARAAYDRGATFTALTYLGSVTITGAGEHMPAWTIKMRNAASTGTPHNVDFNDLTEESSPAAGDKIPGWLASGELRMFDVGNMPSGGASGSGGSAEPFSGAMVRKSVDQSPANYTAGAVLTWDQEIYDTDAFHDNSSSPERLTCPAGFDGYVVVTLNLLITDITADLITAVYIRKNGSDSWDGAGSITVESGSNTPTICCCTGAVPATAGNYFDAFLIVQTDTAITIKADRSNFSIRVVG